MNRGELTDDVQIAALRVLGREITQGELHLMPYVQYVVLNMGVFDPGKVSVDEEPILATWESQGHILIVNDTLHIRRSFYEAITAILWDGYVETPLSEP